MKSQAFETTSAEKLKAPRRKAVTMSQESLVKAECLEPGATLPLVLSPAVDGVQLLAWAARNRELIEGRLLRHGAILFRNFGPLSASEFERFIASVSSPALEYRERSSPRSQVSGNIYTSTEHPADQSIFLHNENSYQRTWPMKLFFTCVTPARQGGETPIADVRKVLGRIGPKVQERFKEEGVMYVRNYHERMGLSWQTAFQTTDRECVDRYCAGAGIEAEWKSETRLRTRQVGQAITRHHKTGETVWFNHAAFFHVTTLESNIRDALLASLGEDDLPSNTYYGSGSQIETAVLDEIREAYNQEAVVFRWQEGDILMLDNMLVAHGRNPFVGPRKILVGMAEPFASQQH